MGQLRALAGQQLRLSTPGATCMGPRRAWTGVEQAMAMVMWQVYSLPSAGRIVSMTELMMWIRYDEVFYEQRRGMAASGRENASTTNGKLSVCESLPLATDTVSRAT